MKEEVKDIEGIESNFSQDLNRVISYMKEKVVRDLPTPVLNCKHFMIAILGDKKSKAYDLLTENSSEMTLESLYDLLFSVMSSTSITAIKPNRTIKFSEDLNEALKSADEERVTYGEEKISSDHVLLALLRPDSKDEKIKKAFNKFGIDYSIISTSHIMALQAMKSSKENKDESKKTNSEIKDKGGDIFLNTILNSGWGGTVRKVDKKDRSKTPEYCTNLNELAKNGKIDHLVGREKEIKDIVRTLGRRKKNNIVLVGSEGVGKTAIAEGLANLIEEEKVPNTLIGKELISLDMTALIAGTTLRGMFEERVQDLLDILKRENKYILFIDNIDTVLADKGKNEYDITAMLSMALENGDVQVIGTAGYKGYRNTFDANPSLSRKFQKINVEPPTKDETLAILSSISTIYENYHRVKYGEDVLNTCLELADKYITERNLPDSAIDILDEAGAELNAEDTSVEVLFDIRKNINDIHAKIKECKKKEEFDEVDKLELEKRDYVTKLKEETERINKEREENPPVVTADLIFDIVSSKTGIPISKLNSDDKQRLLTIEDRLRSEVIGQDEAVEVVSKSLKRNRVGLRNGRTMGSFLFLGPTGTGKTLLAKKLAKEMFGDEKALVRFDMSEYVDKTSVNKLIGANPGYVGYEEGGLMTESIKNKKHCVLLLDEIEKADKEVYNMFLQVFDEGFLTDNSGQKIDFKNVIIILTSNVGVKNANDFGKGMGFDDDENENKKKILSKELKKRFPPEFINRLDNIVYFNSLNDESLSKIISIEMEKLSKRILNMGCVLEYKDDAVKYILGKIREEKDYGARPVIRAIQDEFEDRITDVILEKNYSTCHVFQIMINNGEVHIY